MRTIKAIIVSLAAICSSANAGYLDLGIRGNKAELETLYHAKGGVNVKVAANESGFSLFGLGYGVRTKEFELVGGIQQNELEEIGHFAHGIYRPEKMPKLSIDVSHTRYSVDFGLGYNLSESWGIRFAITSNENVFIGFRKWID